MIWLDHPFPAEKFHIYFFKPSLFVKGPILEDPISKFKKKKKQEIYNSVPFQETQTHALKSRDVTNVKCQNLKKKNMDFSFSVQFSWYTMTVKRNLRYFRWDIPEQYAVYMKKLLKDSGSWYRRGRKSKSPTWYYVCLYIWTLNRYSR